MEPARKRVRQARGPLRADRAVPSDEIPTLEITVQVPVLESPRPPTTTRRPRVHPRRSSRRASRRIIGAVALGLLGALGIAMYMDRPDGATRPNRPPARGSTLQPPVEMPTLVLLTETARGLAPNTPGAELLQSTTELLSSRQLLDEPTVDFALQSLQAIQLADPANPVPRQRLEHLTRQLADEARSQHDQGNEALAARLIRQATQSGVASAYVKLAVDYIARTPTDGPDA